MKLQFGFIIYPDEINIATKEKGMRRNGWTGPCKSKVLSI
jgi:hypothetical protein